MNSLLTADYFQILAVHPVNSQPAGETADGSPLYHNDMLVPYFGTPYFVSTAGAQAFGTQDVTPSYTQLDQIPLSLPAGLILHIENPNLYSFASSVDAVNNGGMILNSALNSNLVPLEVGLGPQVFPFVAFFVALAIIAIVVGAVIISTQVILPAFVPCFDSSGTIVDNADVSVYRDRYCVNATTNKHTGVTTFDKPPRDPGLTDNLVTIVKVLAIGAAVAGGLYLATTVVKSRRPSGGA
jgi:hypothetical protein